MANDKIQLMHPEGKNAPAIKLTTYKLFETAILKTLGNNPPMTYTQIANGVNEEFAKNKVSFDGMVEWYTICVKQHLESQGKIETYLEKGIKMHRLTTAI